MKKWKVLFIGIGSIAKRHMKNLTILMEQREETVQIDAFRSNGRQTLSENVKKTLTEIYYSEEAVPYDYDVIFVTNPTQMHLQSIEKFHTKGKHFFIEKPLCTVEQLKEAKTDLCSAGVYYVAAPLRYSSVIQYIKTHIRVEDVLSIRCISSSYLPEWRAGIDYRETYSAHKALGGGVSIDLIHEWDYITYLFGVPYKVDKYIRKISDLEIDSDDLAVYIADFGHMLAEVHVDYIGRSPVRQMEIITKDDTIVCDLIESSMLYKKSKEVIRFGQKRDGYQLAELKFFWALIDTQTYGDDNIRHACKVLEIAGGI